MPRLCVVGVGVGKWYPRGLARQLESLNAHAFPGDILHWSGTYPPGSPSHELNPYAFKLHAIEEARKQGYDQVFYLDASMYAIRTLAPLLELLNERGYLLWNASWQVGQWCTDEGLRRMGIDRELAMTIEMAIGGCVAFDFRNKTAVELFDAWMAHALDGVSFVGPWENSRGSMCSDPRVLGHRHDMPFLGFHSWRLRMKRIDDETLMQYQKPSMKESTVIACQGML